MQDPITISVEPSFLQNSTTNLAYPYIFFIYNLSFKIFIHTF